MKELLLVMISSGLLLGILKYWGKQLENITSELWIILTGFSWKKTIVSQREIYESLLVLKETFEANHVLILYAENNGGIPKPDCQLYSSVNYEVKSKNSKSVRKRWQRQPIDMEYTRMLSNLVTLKHLTLKTKEMDSGDLKDVYSNNRIAQSEVIELGRTRKRYYYLSIPLPKETELTSQMRDELRVQVNLIKKNLL